MKTHTSQFKDSIKQFGRELDSKITYTIDGVTTELGAEQLNSVSPHYEGAVLKSVMKQLDIDSNVEIPVGTILTYQFGVKVGNAYEYIAYGNYVVKEVEKQEDTNSYKITCYDKMLYAMKDYEKPTGKNLFDKDTTDFDKGNYLNSNGVVTSGTNWGIYYIPIKNNLPYTISGVTTNSGVYFWWMDGSKNALSLIGSKNNYTNITAPNNAKYLGLSIVWNTTSGAYDGNTFMVEQNSTATSYEDYFKYPTTVRDYLHTICYDIGLELKEGQFSNYDKQIQNELYLDENGNSLNYTYRDVLDEIAQVSGGTICIDADDKLEIRYIQDVGEITNVSSSGISLTDGKEGKLQKFELEGKTTQASTPSPDNPSELVSVGYKNLLEPTLSINGTNIRTVNASILLNNDVFTFTATGADMYFGQIIASGSAYGEYAGILIDVSNLSSIYYYLSNPLFTKNLITRYDENKISMGYAGLNSSQGMYTIPSGTKYISFRFGYGNAVVGTTYETKVMITKGTQVQSYIPYNKYGIEVKTIGKNLFDYEGFKKTYPTRTSGEPNNFYFSSNGNECKYYGNFEENTTYHISGNWTSTLSNGQVKIYYADSTEQAIMEDYSQSTSKSGTISVNTYSNKKIEYIRFITWGNGNYTLTNFQIEKGSQATSYEAYKGNSCVYTLDEPLRSIGTYKDKLYIKNNMLYVERKIGKYVMTGSEDWQIRDDVTQTGYTCFRNGDYRENTRYTASNITNAKSNYFEIKASYEASNMIRIININYYGETVVISNNIASTVSAFKSWLSTHNTEVNYVLATPYIEELGSVQVPSTYEGTTYIQTTDANTPTMNISYVSGYEEIDEEMLKDVNVNFGEKYGTINTVVLSRSAGADKISLSQPLDLADEDKVAIEIADNQIMNGNNRADFLQGLLTQLNGLEYYINDFSSTGICYLDLCDMYRVKIGDTSYKCIMFNDSVNITQGLEEQVYTDMPEEAEEDYKYIGDDDRKVTQAYIIADKTRGEIVAVTNKIDETNGRINSVETRQTATEQTIEVKTQNIDADGNITEVTTTNGFTFNAQGLDIHTSDNAFHTTIDEDSTEYKDGDTVVSTTSKDGSALRQLRMLEQNYYSYNASNTSDIMDTSNYDFVDERVEDDGDYVYATFYNGED